MSCQYSSVVIGTPVMMEAPLSTVEEDTRAMKYQQLQKMEGGTQSSDIPAVALGLRVHGFLTRLSDKFEGVRSKLDENIGGPCRALAKFGESAREETIRHLPGEKFRSMVTNLTSIDTQFAQAELDGNRAGSKTTALLAKAAGFIEGAKTGSAERAEGAMHSACESKAVQIPATVAKTVVVALSKIGRGLVVVIGKTLLAVTAVIGVIGALFYEIGKVFCKGVKAGYLATKSFVLNKLSDAKAAIGRTAHKAALAGVGLLMKAERSGMIKELQNKKSEVLNGLDQMKDAHLQAIDQKLVKLERKTTETVTILATELASFAPLRTVEPEEMLASTLAATMRRGARIQRFKENRETFLEEFNKYRAEVESAYNRALAVVEDGNDGEDYCKDGFNLTLSAETRLAEIKEGLANKIAGVKKQLVEKKAELDRYLGEKADAMIKVASPVISPVIREIVGPFNAFIRLVAPKGAPMEVEMKTMQDSNEDLYGYETAYSGGDAFNYYGDNDL